MGSIIILYLEKHPIFLPNGSKTFEKKNFRKKHANQFLQVLIHGGMTLDDIYDV